MIQTISNYRVEKNSDIQHVLSSINGMLTEKVIPVVTITDKQPTRSMNQNRLMHKWFKDIDNVTHQGVIYESGRCKMQYFLPVMKQSDNEICVKQRELFNLIYKVRGREYLSEILGRSLIECTRLLSVKEFAQALTDMQIGEAEYPLTEPQLFGLDERL